MDVKKPHTGQFYIFTLQNIELFLEGISKYPKLEENISRFIKKDMTINEFCDEFIKTIKNEPIKKKLDQEKIDIKKSSIEEMNELIKNMNNFFSYNKIAEVLFDKTQNKSQVSNYMNSYLNQFIKIPKDVYKAFFEFDKCEDIDKLRNELEKEDPDFFKKVEAKIEFSYNQPAKVNNKLVVWEKLEKLVTYTTETSNFFDNRIFLYYLFFEWHSVDINLIMQLKENRDSNIDLDFSEDLINITSQLISNRVSVDHKETKKLLDEYFVCYSKFISNPDIVNALQYSVHTCVDFIIKPDTIHSLFKDLCYVFYNSFSFNKPLISISTGKSSIETGNQKVLYHYPQSLKNDQDSFNWKGAFDASFPEITKRDDLLNKLLTKICDKNDYPKIELYEIMASSLRYASPIPDDLKIYNSNINHFENYNGIDCGINFKIPYIPIIDSPLNHLYCCSDFEFKSDSNYSSPKPNTGIFDQLNILEQLKTDAQEKAKRAGRDGISERKIFIYNSIIQPNATHFTMNLGKIDFFTGVARRDFFINYLSPSSANINKLLSNLTENKLLEFFLPKDLNAKLFSLAYIENPNLINSVFKFNKKDTTDELLKILKKIISENDELNNFSYIYTNEQEVLSSFINVITNIKESIKNKMNEMYDLHISANTIKHKTGDFEIGDTGTTFTGCGTFVLTTDIGPDGKDRPWLLLERRWKVSEQSGALCYSSAGSCDMYDPGDYIHRAKKGCQIYDPIYESAKLDEYVFSEESYWDLEANPFLTAVRELKEELSLKIQPEQLDLICYGVDVNRNLQQFSFLHKSNKSAEEILKKASIAPDSDEGITFIVPFNKDIIYYILNNYQLESAAVYALTRIVEIKKDLLWDCK